jgi:hypothetical protein
MHDECCFKSKIGAIGVIFIRCNRSFSIYIMRFIVSFIDFRTKENLELCFKTIKCIVLVRKKSSFEAERIVL